MRFGVQLCNAGPGAEREFAIGLARMAEELGYDSLWTVEHVVVPTSYESVYPYSRTGKMPGGGDVPTTDPLIWLAFVAAVTERIQLGTAILILPQRNPVVLAKECASLDRLAGGRLQLGVGVGWLREEFEALGVPFEDRGARTDEYVEAMRTLWRQDEPSFSGRFAAFDRAKMLPKPARDIPIVVGGHSEAAARRAGRLGDGFFPLRVDKEELVHLLELMRATAREHGRDADAIEITTGGRLLDLDAVKRYQDAGVHRVVMTSLEPTLDGARRTLETFADEVMAKV